MRTLCQLLLWEVVLAAAELREFDFGSNWLSFTETLTTQGTSRQDFKDALTISKRCLLNFLSPAKISPGKFFADEDVLKGQKFLDIGSGSGLHSAAAAISGASVASFDAQQGSVDSTMGLANMFLQSGLAKSWETFQGNILELSEAIAANLRADVVYSWGVLHHTGAMHRAIKQACSCVRPVDEGGGLLLIALYAREVVPDPNYWIAMKQAYLRMGDQEKRHQEFGYAWHLLKKGALEGQNPFVMMYESKLQRGMDFWTDVRDQLGGYPIEYSETVDIVKFVREECGFIPLRIDSSAVTEYLFAPHPQAFRTGQTVNPLLQQWYGTLSSRELYPLEGNFVRLWPAALRGKCFCTWLPEGIAADAVIEVLEDGLLFGFAVELEKYSTQGMKDTFLKEEATFEREDIEWKLSLGFDGKTCERPGRFIQRPVASEGGMIVVFSPSDGSDPNDGLHSYSLRVREEDPPLPRS